MDLLHVACVEEVLALAVEVGVVEEVDPLPGVGHRRQHHRGLDAVVEVVADGGLAALSALGGHEDDAEGCAGAVDGGGSGVLEDGDALDVLGVEHRQAALHAVDEDERVSAGSGADGAGAADVDALLLVELTASSGVVDVQAGDDALEGEDGVGDRTGFDVLGGRDADGSGEVDLLLDTETDDDDFVEQCGVFGEGHGEVGGGGHALGDVADAGDLEGRSGSDAEFEVAFDVGDDTGGGAGHDDGSSDDSLSVGVDDFAARDGLGVSPPPHKQQSQGSRKRHQRFAAC